MYNIETIIDETIANKLMELAKQHRENSDYYLSEKSYLDALKLREKLSTIDLEKYAPLVIETLNDLAQLHKEQEAYSAVIEYYRKVITVARTLFQQTSKLKYASLLALTMTNIANLHTHYYENHKLALYFYNEAHQIYTMLLSKENYLHNQIQILEIYIALGIIYQKMNAFKKSEENYLNALTTCETLIEEGVENYQDKLGLIHSDLATLYFTNKHEKLAQENYLVALDILIDSANKEYQFFRETIAIVQNNLANIYVNQNNYSKAKHYFKSALQRFTHLADEHPAKYIDFVTALFKNIALLYLDQGEHKKAAFFHLKTIKIYEEFIQYDAEKYNIELAATIIEGVQYYGQHSLSLYRAESILRTYDWYDEAEVLLGKICKLKSERAQELVE